MSLIHILEETGSNIFTPVGSGVEALVSTVVLWLILTIEIIAALMISLGVVLTLVRLARFLFERKGEGYEKARLTLARFLALALEFQLAADVMSTAVAPSWTQIGKLGAIAVIRTALNYFLAREIKGEDMETNTAPLLEAGLRLEG